MAVTQVATRQVADLAITDGKLAGSIGDGKLATSYIKADGTRAFTGNQSAGGNKITNLGTPTADADAATKAYVDAMKQGLDVKDSVRAATTTNITLSGTQTVDGVALSANDRVLVKDQSAGADNGIYLCAAGAWTRTTDADSSADVTAGMYAWVEEGTVNGDTGWILTTNNPITLATTALVFSQFSGAGQIVAGAGLTKNGNTLDVGAGSGITVAADSVAITTAGVTETHLSTSVAGAGLTGGGGAALAVGAGTGITVNANDVAISAGGVGVTQLATAVAGNGLTGGGGAALAVGAGSGIQVNADDVAIAAGGVTATHLAAAVAGNGLTGGGGSALAVGAGTGIAVGADTVGIAAGGVGITELSTAVAGNGLTGGGGAALAVGAGNGLSVSADAVKLDGSWFIANETPTGAINGSNVTFTLANTPFTGTVQVYLNGILQDPGAGNDYTISAGTITMLSAPLTGDKIRVHYVKNIA